MWVSGISVTLSKVSTKGAERPVRLGFPLCRDQEQQVPVAAIQPAAQEQGGWYRCQCKAAQESRLRFRRWSCTGEVLMPSDPPFV